MLDCKHAKQSVNHHVLEQEQEPSALKAGATSFLLGTASFCLFGFLGFLGCSSSRRRPFFRYHRSFDAIITTTTDPLHNPRPQQQRWLSHLCMGPWFLDDPAHHFNELPNPSDLCPTTPVPGVLQQSTTRVTLWKMP